MEQQTIKVGDIVTRKNCSQNWEGITGEVLILSYDDKHRPKARVLWKDSDGKTVNRTWTLVDNLELIKVSNV